MKFVSRLLFCVVVACGALSKASGRSLQGSAEDELILQYAGDDTGCDNPLDEARILVAVADFLQEFYANNGVVPDPQSLNKTETCDAKYYPCDMELGGGCCSGSVCKRTSNGLQRCVKPSYTPELIPNGSSCERERLCQAGLSCQNSVCQPIGRRLEADVSVQRELLEPLVVSTGLEFKSKAHRRLYGASWCQRGRTCGRCSTKNFRKYNSKQRAYVAKFCRQLCMFHCGRKRSLQEEENSSSLQMDSFVAALTSYIHMLDFGDDCNVEGLVFSWTIGQPDESSA